MASEKLTDDEKKDMEDRYTLAREYYKQTRKQIMHEDGLINQRFTWLLTMNGFLFGAFALSLMAQAQSRPTDDNIYWMIITTRLILALTAIIASIIASTGVHAACKSLTILICNWKNYMKENTDIQKHFTQISGGNGEGNIPTDGFKPSTNFPTLFIIFWILIMLVQAVFIKS